MPIMAERIRVTFEVSDRVRRALNICAARSNQSLGELIEQMAEELIPDDLVLADKSISDGSAFGTHKRGRPRKAADD